MHTPGQEGLQMIEATSCGGVVIFRGKLLVLYKNYRNKYEGWVLPKGTVEPGEDFKQTALLASPPPSSSTLAKASTPSTPLRIPSKRPCTGI